MPVTKDKKGSSVTGSGMSAADAQAAAEAASVKAATEVKAKKEADERAEEARKKLASYQLKKAAEAAKVEREQKANAEDAHEKVAAYQASKGPKKYVVQAGDSLSKIAKEQLGDARRYPEIQKLNKIDNPNLIRVGQELLLPD